MFSGSEAVLARATLRRNQSLQSIVATLVAAIVCIRLLLDSRSPSPIKSGHGRGGGSMGQVRLPAIIIASLAGLLFGFDTAVISGVTEALRTVFSLTPGELGWAVSAALWLPTLKVTARAAKRCWRY